MRSAATGMVLLGTLARPVPPDPAPHILLDATSRPVPSARGRCTLHVGSVAHDLRLWLDRDRMHAAVLGPLGSPRLVLRMDGRAIALQTGPDVVVAPHADPVLQDIGWPKLADLIGLWVGRLPSGPHASSSLPDGRVWAGRGAGAPWSWSMIVHPDRGVELLDLPLAGVSLSRSSARSDGLPDTLRVHLRDEPAARVSCAWTLAPAPEAAFVWPTARAISLEELGSALWPSLRSQPP